MKVAVVHNLESLKVINLFGLPNRERYSLEAIRRIANFVEAGGHQVIALKGDKDFVDNLQNFMPQAPKGERPGMVFNPSYGIEGQARYPLEPPSQEKVQPELTARERDLLSAKLVSLSAYCTHKPTIYFQERVHSRLRHRLRRSPRHIGHAGRREKHLGGGNSRRNLA